MQKARGHAGPKAIALPPLVGTGFQVQCPPLNRGSSHRSVALLGSLSVVVEYLALRDGPREFRPGFPCPTLLGRPDEEPPLHLRGFHPLWRDFPTGFGSRWFLVIPGPRPRTVTRPVWALPRSLAATEGVSVDFLSAGY